MAVLTDDRPEKDEQKKKIEKRDIKGLHGGRIGRSGGESSFFLGSHDGGDR